jgi:S-adenosylmethionine decarboxylase
MNGGAHVILDVIAEKDCEWMGNIQYLNDILEECALQSKATILESKWHHFGEGHGVTGVLLLAESHITCHTFPEVGLACFDIFMCGNCDPQVASAYLTKVLSAHEFRETYHARRAY